MPYEYQPMREKKPVVKESEAERELRNIERDREQAEQNLELWSGSLKAVLEDLAEVEEKEGELDPEDPRLTAVRLCLMRTDEAKTMLKDLKEEREEVANRAGLN
ncbi:hypothetical protein M0Q28_00710 [Patescibacteria group bacterium]|jgi:hypothetical protein|nr:hypothetical protein [Patescibacteria group bacterium]